MNWTEIKPYIKTGIIAFLTTSLVIMGFKMAGLQEDVEAAKSAELSAKMELASVHVENMEKSLGYLQTISEKNDRIDMQQHDINMLTAEVEASR